MPLPGSCLHSLVSRDTIPARTQKLPSDPTSPTSIRGHETKIRCIGTEKKKIKLLHLVDGIILSLEVAKETTENL